MKKYKRLSLILLVFISCQAINPKQKPINPTDKSAPLVQADNTFGFELFSQTVANANPNTNTVVSPLSVSLSLSMAYNGAAGVTKTEIEHAMKVEGLTPEEINLTHQALMDSLKLADPQVVLEIANAIYYRKSLSVEHNFISTNQKYYIAEVSALNFSQPIEALKTINGWVDEKTHGKIPTILNQDQIDVNLVMILLNAVYFNGLWQSKFDETKTQNDGFILNDGSSKDTPMMTQTTRLEYASNELFSAVNLPYGKGKFQMTVILPNQNKTTRDVIGNLNTDNWQSWQKNFTTRNQLVLTMPKFKFSWNMTLNEVLQKMGMKEAFCSNANFSGISKSNKIGISQVIHETYIDVNEKGTEASAITDVRPIDGIGVDPRTYFKVDHPFLFAITEKTTGAILFIGEITNPEYPN